MRLQAFCDHIAIADVASDYCNRFTVVNCGEACTRRDVSDSAVRVMHFVTDAGGTEFVETDCRRGGLYRAAEFGARTECCDRVAGLNGQRCNAFPLRNGRKGFRRKVFVFQVDLSGRYRADEFAAHVVRLSDVTPTIPDSSDQSKARNLIDRMGRKRTSVRTDAGRQSGKGSALNLRAVVSIHTRQ